MACRKRINPVIQSSLSSYRSLSLTQPTIDTTTPLGPPTTSTARRLDLLPAARPNVGQLFVRRVFIVAGLLPPAVGHNKTIFHPKLGGKTAAGPCS